MREYGKERKKIIWRYIPTYTIKELKEICHSLNKYTYTYIYVNVSIYSKTAIHIFVPISIR